jgi:hypothetical protein
MTRAPDLYRPHTRRGNYVLLFLASLLVMLGLGALVIDIAYVSWTQAQAQDVADASAQAGIVVLRQTGDPLRAEDAADRVIFHNQVAGQSPVLARFDVGTWDVTSTNPVFVPTRVRPNAVRTRVTRMGANGVPLFLSQLWGYDDFDVDATAVSAALSSQILFVVDVTHSWTEAEFRGARNAALAALDALAPNASVDDEVALLVFANKFAWTITEFTRIRDPAAAAIVRDAWDDLNISSRAGKDDNPFDGRSCVKHTSSRVNDFVAPAGGCYPDMPRKYYDETGTDHSVGLGLAQEMFNERRDDVAYRSVILLTDGRPLRIPWYSGRQRVAAGYEEERFREYEITPPRTDALIRSEAQRISEELFDNLGVNIWVVSFIADDPLMQQMVQGDGYFERTNDPDTISTIFTQIISEMPLVLVE